MNALQRKRTRPMLVSLEKATPSRYFRLWIRYHHFGLESRFRSHISVVNWGFRYSLIKKSHRMNHLENLLQKVASNIKTASDDDAMFCDQRSIWWHRIYKTKTHTMNMCGDACEQSDVFFVAIMQRLVYKTRVTCNDGFWNFRNGTICITGDFEL